MRGGMQSTTLVVSNDSGQIIHMETDVAHDALTLIGERVCFLTRLHDAQIEKAVHVVERKRTRRL